MVDVKSWSEQTSSVTMTNDEWAGLYVYLHRALRQLEDELEAWERRAQEKMEDGSTKYPKAADIAEYYRQNREELAHWLAKISTREA